MENNKTQTRCSIFEIRSILVPYFIHVRVFLRQIWQEEDAYQEAPITVHAKVENNETLPSEEMALSQ